MKTWQKPETALEKSLEPRVISLWQTNQFYQDQARICYPSHSLRKHPFLPAPLSAPLRAGEHHVPPRETSPVAKSEEKRMFSQATLPKEIDLQLQCLLYSGLLRSRTGRSHASSLRVACVTPARAAARGRLAVLRTFKWSKNTSKLQNTVIRVRSKKVETVSNQVKWVKSVQYMSPYMRYLPWSNMAVRSSRVDMYL